MKIILNFILCMCLLVGQLTPFAPFVASLKFNKEVSVDVSDTNTVTTTDETDETDESYEAEVKNFRTLDLEGYCTISVPLSHFSIDTNNSTQTYKQVDYNDNKTRLYMSYVTDMPEGTDVAGYICKEKAGIDTATNDKQTETYNNVEWVRIKADKKENDCTVYVWYTLNKTGDSAFWIKAKVAEGSDDQKFFDIMAQTLNTYYLYVVSGTIFDTPSTGYYTDMAPSDTVATTDGYEANNNEENQVFNSRGGYVIGADISNNWEDLEIILDGHKFSLPSTLKTFQDAGYTINDRDISSDKDMIVFPLQTLLINVENTNGTTIKLVAYNESATEEKNAKDCSIVGLRLDINDYKQVAATIDGETFNQESADSEMAADNAKDSYNHELILANGVTWGIYNDDLRNIYGACTVASYSPTVQQFNWKSGTKRMEIRTGAVCKIQYVELACMEY